jgi:multidrug efflux pump subunit AcrB
MSIANTFIRRPVLSTVCTLLILMVGLIAIPQLPINNLPDIAPIQVQTRAFSIGADAQTVEESVSTVIERQINGVEGMQYMTSTSGNDGSSSISAFFAPSSDRNINQVNVQNRVAIAQPTLPASVRQTGVTTVARSNSILRVYGFYAENSEYDNLFCLDNSRFKEVKDFENLVIKTQADGTLIKLKDVGRAELGARDYTTSSLVQGKPGVGMLIYQLPGSNALNTAKALETRLAQLEANFPPGIKSVVCYDTTKFVEVSIEEVVKTLIEAILLVVLVIFIFLQEWRATIIPAITVPVSLIGAMAFAYALGFSLNNLTLFALYWQLD